jgi:signal transduction histidine kinase
MAWTTSATQRGSYALGLGVAAARLQIANCLISLGNGDLVRGVSVAGAIALTISGAAVPYVAPELLTALLCCGGVALALMAGCLSRPGGMNEFTIVKAAEDWPQHRAGSVPAVAALQDLPELWARPARAGADLAVWAKLTSRMSHELRTPLNAVLGFSEMMSNEVFGPLGSAQYASYVSDIHASGRQLLKSAEDALAITQLLISPQHKLAGSVASPAAAVADALAFHATEIRARSIEIVTAVPDDLEVVADLQTLRQILINLMAEALATAADGAMLSIRLLEINGELDLELHVAGQNHGALAESFAMLLARTLAELSGARFHLGHDDGGDWRVNATFQRASQSDFFRMERRAC